MGGVDAVGRDAAGEPEAQPLALRVRAELERLILEGELQPGERLNEVALAKRMGVSRGPVREAARALEKSGLVTVILNRGAFVRELDMEEAMQIYELNGLLFGFAAWQVASAVTAAQAVELRDLVSAMDRAVEAGEPDAFFALNLDFHRRIMGFARNRQAEALYAGFATKLLLFRRRSFDRSGNMEAANTEHHRLLEAIIGGKADLARQIAEDHSRSGRARFLGAMDDGPAVAAGKGARARRAATPGKRAGVR